MGTSREYGIFNTFLVFVFCLHSVLSLPTPQTGCPVLECTSSNNIFSYQAQHTYTYKLEATSENVLSGATVASGGPSGKLHLTAIAELQAVSPCQFGLSIKQVQVTGSDGKKHGGLSSLEGKPVQIGLQDGKLVPEFCSDAKDDINTLNLKRAVASLLQVATSSEDQTDVFGDCPVEVTVSKGGEGINMVNTHRDLNRCKRRENIISDIPSSTYLFNSETQAAPLLTASAKIQQRVKSGILEAATSHEEYSYRPFSNQGSGAHVSVHTSLTLQSQKPQLNFKAPSASKLHSVVFEPPHSTGTDLSKADNVANAIIKACEAMPHEAKAESAHLVHQVVQVMRQTSKDDLLGVYGRVKSGAGFKNKDCARRVFLDSALYTGTGEAVEVMASLIKNKQIEEPALFYTRLAFTRHATLSSLTAVTALLEQGNPPRELVLGAGSLAGNYFDQHDHQPEKEIDNLLLKIARPLGNCLPKSHDQENRVLTAMKGIHNAHYIPDEVANKLKECATNKKASTRVRSAALDSIQGDAANKKLKQVAYDILGDLEEDSELRIKAYLVLATCPCGNVANFVRDLLEKEPVNQVGSFIVTHLRNLRASSNPEKESAKKHLAGIHIPSDKFSVDVRKYSSNTELSYAFGKANAAASAEANVIFSQNSFLPRFTSLNLTSNLFGHSFNLFEVGLRAENLEHMLESYFGPKGYFNSHSPNEVLESGKESVTKLADKIKARASKSFRGRRSVAKADLDKMAAKVQMHDDSDSINLDVYLKLFGAELAFLSYYGDPTNLRPSAIVDKIFDAVDKTIGEAKNFDYKLKQHLMLFDTELVYPTATGFPLKLMASSTAALHIMIGGNFDVQAIGKDPKNAEMRLNLMPSAALDVAGELQIDFFAAAAGLKHEATLHTSTGLELTFKTLNGKGFDLNIGTPLSKQEIVTAKSELFATTKDRGNLQVDTPLQFSIPRRSYQGCFDQLSPLIGLTFCGDVGFPFEGVPKKGPIFPLDGPAKLVARIEKDENSLTGYNLRALYTDQDPDRRSLEITFNTPGSSTDRTVAFLFEANKKPNYELKMSLKSPIKSASVSGVLINNAQEHSITGTFEMDDQKYQARLGLKVTGDNEKHAEYKPILTYSGPGGDNKGNQEVTLDGTITRDFDKEAKKHKYTFSALTLVTPRDKFSLDGYMGRDQELYSLDITFKYNNLAEFIKAKIDSRKVDDTYHLYLEGHTSQYPDLAFAVNYDLKHAKGLLDNKLKVHHGTDLKNEINCLTVSQYYKFVGGGEAKDFELTTKNQVSYPALEVKLHLDAEATRRSLHYIIEGGFDQHQLSSELTLKHSIPAPEGQQNPRDPGGYELTFKAGAGGKTIIIDSSRQIVTIDTSKLHFKVTLLPKNIFVEVNSDCTHRFQKGDLKLKVTNVLSFSNHPHKYTLCTGMQSNVQNCEGHIKFSKDEENLFLIKAEGVHGDPETGTFNVLLKGYLEGSGTYSHSKSNNQGSLNAELSSAKLDRKVKITGDLKPGAKATASLVTFDILLDADKDPSNKVHLESNIDVAKDGRTFDTKSSLVLNSKKFNLNLKGVTPCRIPTDAGVHVRMDGQLELPSGQKISAYTNFAKLQPKDGNGYVTNTKLDDGQGAKLNYEGKYSRVAGFVLPTYDAYGKLNLVAPGKKDITLQMNVQNREVENKQAIDYKFDVTGNLIPQPLHTTVTLELLDQPRYHLVSTYGDKFSADVAGHMSLKNDLEKFGEVNMEVKTNVEGYEQVKGSSSFKMTRENNNCKLSTKEYLEINGARRFDSKFEGEFKKEEGHTEGTTELSLLLGADEKEARIFTNKYDYKGPNVWKINLESPATLHLSSTLRQGSEKFGMSVDSSRPGDGTPSGKMTIEMFTPLAKYPNIKIVTDHKSLKGNRLHQTEIDYYLGADSHIHANGEVDMSEQRRSFGLQFVRVKPAAANPLLKVMTAYTKPTTTEVSGELDFAYGEADPRAIAIAANVKYPGGFEEFELTGTVNSETLKLKNVAVEITSKTGSKGGKRINISAKSPEKTYLQGSTSFQKKDDGKSIIYEGQGNIKVGEESRTSSFRLVTKQLTTDKDQETGYDAKLTADLTGSNGKQTLEIHNKLTDKTLRVFDKYCNQESKCSQIEVSNTLKAWDVSEVHVENAVEFDLHSLTGAPAFRLGGKFERKNFEFEYLSEAQFGKGADATIYRYESFWKKHKGAVHLVLPKRTIAFDSSITTPEDVGKSKSDSNRSYKFEATLALDQKRQPDQKLTLTSTMDVAKGKEAITYSSDVKISHPALNKDLIVKSKSSYSTGQVLVDSSVTFDVFANKKQAVVISLKNEKIPVNGGYNLTSLLTVVSKGQNLDFKVLSHAIGTKSEIGFGSVTTLKDDKLGVSESAVLFSVTLEKVLLLVRAPTSDLLRLQGECKRSKTEITKSHFELAVLQSLAVEGEFLGYKSFKLQGFDISNPGDKLVYSGSLDLDKQLVLKGEQLSGGKSSKLFSLLVPLDSKNFLNVEHSVNTEEIKASLEKLQTAGKNTGDKLAALIADTSKDCTSRSKAFVEALKKSQPNFKPLINRLKEQYQAMQEEIKTDESIKELIDLIKNLFSSFAQTFSKALETMTVHIDKLSVKIQEATAKFTELAGKLGPILTEAAGRVSKAFAAVFATSLEILTKLTAKIIETIKENSAEIQKYVTLITDFIKEQGKQIRELMGEVRIYMEEFIQACIEQIKSIPMFENIKDQYKEYYNKFVVQFEGTFHEIAETLKEVLPTPELKELVDAIVKYIDKKVKKEPVDEIEELNTIVQKIVKAATALLKYVGATSPPGLPQYNVQGLLKLAATPISLDSLSSLTKLFSLRVSILDLLASDDLPSAADLLATYSVPRRFDDVLPPHRAFGQISSSQHFFTFDGYHYTLKGDCQYLLARDFDDGNFSLAVELAGGKLRSVSLIDSQDSVEIKADHTVLLNGQTVELPVHHNELAMFRTLHGVHVKSKSGVSVTCDLHHELCSFAINGYYFGKTRGLLGTITNEKYDDLALPNGKIATTVQQFANAYKLGESCVNQAPVEHKHSQNKDCGFAFSSQDTLKMCFPFVDPTPYRHACEDAADEGKTPEATLKAICEASAAYVTKCRDATFLHPSLPTTCVHCDLGGKETEVGSAAAVKAPQSKADIVILVEQLAENEAAFNEFLTPLTTSLNTDLKNKGVSDVHYSLIGYGGPGQRWPSLFTSNGKFSFDGKTKPSQLTFGKKAPEPVAKSDANPLAKFLDRARDFTAIEFGQTGLGQAFQQVLHYPFRADAAKGVFLLRSSPCKKSPLFLSLQQLQMLHAREFFQDRGIVVSFLQPVEITTTAGDKKLIGFDSDNALTYGKKQVDPAIRSEIDYSADSCASFIDLVQPTVLSMKNFKDIKAGQRKNFIAAASSRLANLLAGTEVTQSCECRLHEGLHPEARCSVTATKDAKAAGPKKGNKA